MRQFVLVCYFSVALLCVHAQSGSNIISALRSIHQAVNADSNAAISHRAMNVFLADKTGYLCGSRDLSYFTNYVTFNSAEARFTVNHNFQQAATGNDAPLKQLLSMGFNMTIANQYAQSFLDKRFENEIGLTVNYKWLGKTHTHFLDDAAIQKQPGQKQKMDVLRAVMLEDFATAIAAKEAAFNQALAAAQITDTAAARVARENFYTELQQTYEEQFAVEQAALLTRTMNFKRIATHWTSLNAYIPLLFPAYTSASSFNSPFSTKHPYPLALTLGHTRLWENAGKSRIFFTVETALLLNNSKLGYALNKMNFIEYRLQGGTAGQPGSDPGNSKIYIGSFSSFITPSVSGRFVWFASSSHVGLSVYVEKNFGSYHFFNGKLGIPIVLINSKKTPAVTLECYAIFRDITGQRSLSRTLAGLQLGIPFSRLMY